MELTLHKPTFSSADGSIPRSKRIVIGFWIVTALFCVEMTFTAYYEILPQAADAFARLGFPSPWFRAELSLAKVAGVVALLVPVVPARLKEWAYAGFAINLVSAQIGHLSIGDRPLAFVPSALTGVLWVLSYIFWRRLQATPASAPDRAAITSVTMEAA